MRYMRLDNVVLDGEQTHELNINTAALVVDMGTQARVGVIATGQGMTEDGSFGVALSIIHNEQAHALIMSPQGAFTIGQRLMQWAMEAESSQQDFDAELAKATKQ